MTVSPEALLPRAFLAFQSRVEQGLAPATRRANVAWLESACDRITDKLSPPTRLELPHFPCPECGVAWVVREVNRSRVTETDPKKQWKEQDQIAAISVVYRSGDGTGLAKSAVVCANPECGATWQGDYGIRYIAHEFNYFVEHGGPLAASMAIEDDEDAA